MVEATKTDNSWGNQIRSYVFQPYTMVNDHRTEVKVGDVQRVMDGDLDDVHPGVPQAVRRQGGVSAVEERSLRRRRRAREKRAALEAARRRRPFAYRFERTHTAAEALAAYQDAMGEHGPEVAVAGRMVACGRRARPRSLHLEDASGRIQLYFRRDGWASATTLVELLDLDDHIGVDGPLFRTQKGEITVRADDVTLLAKSLRPLPRGKTQAG